MATSDNQLDLRILFTETSVGQLTLTQVPVLTPQQTAAEAAEAMRNVSHGSALICEEGRLVGIITERDLLRLLPDDDRIEKPLADVMTASPRTLTVDDNLLDAVRSMDQGGYRRLPVVNAEHHPVGIVDVKTVMNFLSEHMSATVYNQASGDLLNVREREGA
jgi:CBS domain-containing protein